MRTRVLVGVISLSVLAALAIGAGIYTAYDKKVTLVVGGHSKTVHAFGDTVADVLSKEGIRVGAHDVVAPGASTELEDGTRIAVRFGRPLRLTVDGTSSTHWVTATSVGDALDQLGMRFKGADLSSSRSAGIERDGLAVKVRTKKHVTVVHDHTKTAVDSTALNVSEVLSRAGVKLDGRDRVTPKLGATVDDGDTVNVTRIDIKKRKVTAEIPFETERQPDSSMLEGKSEVAQEGQPGQRLRVFRVRMVDGKKTHQKLLRTKVTEEPVDEIIHDGTKEPEPPPPSSDNGGSDDSGDNSGSDNGSDNGNSGGDSGDSDSGDDGGDVGGGADDLNWAALAQCESGGDPNAVSPGGTYFGLYQFSLSTWHAVGGSGSPIDNSAGEQTYRAKILYKRSGSGQWPVCGSRLYS